MAGVRGTAAGNNCTRRPNYCTHARGRGRHQRLTSGSLTTTRAAQTEEVHGTVVGEDDPAAELHGARSNSGFSRPISCKAKLQMVLGLLSHGAASKRQNGGDELKKNPPPAMAEMGEERDAPG